jgi:hypothetical protein
VPKFSFSHEHLPVSEPAEWLESTLQSYLAHAAQAKALALAGAAPAQFFGFTFLEIDEYFDELGAEADRLATLNLLAACEASLRIDFINRSRKMVKTGPSLNQAFRERYLEAGNRISIVEDILEIWKDHCPGAPAQAIGDFIKSLDSRNWFAHGRYWAFRKGDVFDFADATEVVAKLHQRLDSSPMKFFPNPI